MNTVHLEVSYIKNTKAKGAFVLIIPVLQNVNDVQTSIVPFYQHFGAVKIKVPFGAHRVQVYDIEKEGHLMMPTANPAIVSRVVVLGSFTVIDKSTDEHCQLEIYTEVDTSDLTLRVDCIHDAMSTAESCTVIVRSSKNPDVLVVKVQQREASKSLVYDDIEPETNYTITVFSVNNDGVPNSTICSMVVNVPEIILGMFCNIVYIYQVT